MNVPDDLQQLYGALSDAPLHQGTKHLIERIAQAEQALAELRERYAFQENQRLCVGYAGGCDGDLEATTHEYGCPAWLRT